MSLSFGAPQVELFHSEIYVTSDDSLDIVKHEEDEDEGVEDTFASQTPQPEDPSVLKEEDIIEEQDSETQAEKSQKAEKLRKLCEVGERETIAAQALSKHGLVNDEIRKVACTYMYHAVSRMDCLTSRYRATFTWI